MTNEQLERMAQNDPAAFTQYVCEMNDVLLHHYEALSQINAIMWNCAKAACRDGGVYPIIIEAMQCQGISDGMKHEQEAFAARWE